MKAEDLFQADQQAVEPIPSGISVDPEGDWYYNGAKIIRKDILELFYDHLDYSPEDGFFISWQGRRHLLDAADTPFVITRVDRNGQANGGESIILTLKHLQDQEALDPTTLKVGNHNILYCRIRNGRFPARFSRPAYYQLAQWIEADSQTGEFFLELSGERYPIQVSQ